MIAAIRLDEVISRVPSNLIDIPSEVFSLRGRTGGPYWVKSPPLDFQRRFWNEVATGLPTDSQPYVLTRLFSPQSLRDAHLHEIPGCTHLTTHCAVFFVDLDPLANWAHPCRYVFVPLTGAIEIIDHDWPPDGRIPRVVPSRLAD